MAELGVSGGIPREFIDDLLVRVDIVDLIDSHVPLKKAGSGFVARCPFHAEKSPSFSVNRNKQFYHCFGCGAGGDAISFLMAFSHLDFIEAVEDLAGFAGIDVPREAVEYRQKKQDYGALYTILEQSAIFYVEQLRNNPKAVVAVDYLKQRGLSGDIAKEFSLGYAPNEWDSLASQFDNKLLLEAGMLISKDGGGVYDRFRGRLIFPIKDKRKRIIGFGARVLDDSLPKYLNSPETPVFSKGKELYGLSELLEKNAKPKRILIVEGYMDVLALAQFGISYSVAALGTATSKIHMDLLFRFTSEIVFCFDGDSAGKNAAWKAVKEAFPSLKDGRQVRVVLLPEGHDPDSLVREQGVEGFEQKVESALALSDYFFDHLSKGVDLDTVEGQSALMSKAKPYIEKIPAGFFRDMMFARLSGQSFSGGVEVLRKPAMLNESFVAGRKTIKPLQKVKASPVRIVVAHLLQAPRLIDVFEQKEVDLSSMDFPGLDVLKDVLQAIEEIKPGNSAVLMEYFRGTVNEKVVNTLINWDFYILSQGVEAEFSGAVDQMVQQVDRDRLDDLLQKEKMSGLSAGERELLGKLLVKKI